MAFRPAGDEFEDDWDDDELYLLDDPVPGEKPAQKKKVSSRPQVRGNLHEAGQARRPAEQPAKRRDHNGAPLSPDDFRVAVCRGNLAEVQTFLDRGLQVDCDLQAGWTALMYAASKGHTDIVKFLLDKGADPNFNRASYMYTPLIAACSRNHEESTASCVALLLERGANPNAHERSHMTPLMFAAKNGHQTVTDQLIQCGADVNKEDNRGWTALHFAAELGDFKLVKTLIEAGSDTSRRCAEGTPADIANSQGHDMIGKFIQSGGCLPDGAFAVNGDADGAQVAVKQPIRTDASLADGASFSGYRRYNDLEMFLHSQEMPHLVPVFQKHVIDFSLLQCMTESDLEKIGVEQLGCRKKIIQSIHQLHGKKWEASSVRTPSGPVLSRHESLGILENIHLHVKYISSSIKYIRENWETHGTLENQAENLSNLDNLSKEAGAALKQSRQLFLELHQMKSNLNKVTKSTQIVAADLIRDPDEARGHGVFKYMVTLGLVTTVALSVLWYGGPNAIKDRFIQ
ncbi:ankyrin repeat, SAM and basic leucine zipper domain-containing protein 1-like isoform X1 [Amphiura filiformis]|uniref:ankyrin repeat, SAM and basic leucine zipper domain-containing protein 1-like isoform X1 n=1 Tax=Amphiura filiformis TaxID=82378 RepID=UPI003B2202C6